MTAMGVYLGSRIRALGLVTVVATAASFARPAPPPRTLEGLADLLGGAAAGAVAPGEVQWEPSRGVLGDALLGRRVLFLAAQSAGRERDVYRARVRLSLEGQPVEVTGLRNITETPLGDDAGLEIRGTMAAFATTAYERVQGVTLLDLDGVEPRDRPSSLAGKATLALASYRGTGSFSGLGRVDLVLDTPARAARIELAPPKLHVTVEEPADDVVLDASTGELTAPAADVRRALRVVRQNYRGRSVLAWSVDLIRGGVGATPVAWIERAVFGARDLARRTFAKAFRWSPDSRLKQGKGAEAPVARVLEVSKETSADSGWPPPPVPSLWEAAKPGEGQWTAVTHPFLPKLEGEAGKAAPPYFYTTFIRPDPDRPYTEVLLVAMDMRQLELGMEGGYEEPHPAAGPPGTGRIPRTPGVLPRVAAAFNGAFKAEHGSYGMVVGGRILLPPVAGAATVLVTRDGRAGFGRWPAVAGLPQEVVSLRQNLDPLVDGGVVNPAHRNIWGWQIAGESSLTERTALCLTPGRHIYYAWGRDITGEGLGRALKQAGCDYALHLDMNPRHCGFVFMHAGPGEPGDGKYRLADAGMSINPSRYYLGSDKDFFYVMTRDLARAEDAGPKWVASPGSQPPPAWLPAIHEVSRDVGELSIRVVEFDAGRVNWLVRAGSSEPSVPGAPSKRIGLEPELEGHVVAAVGLGHTTDALRYGLAFEGKTSLELRRTYATVVLSPGLAPRVFLPGDDPKLEPTDAAVQLPLLARDGEVDARASDRGGTRLRGALCVAPAGRVFVAVARHDSSDPLAATLVELGCRTVVALDRGSRHAAFVHRAATPEAPLSSYETSVLYAVARPMTPHAFRYGADP
jgi:hypothetical protein